jgi:hypothetical protein
MQQEEAEDLQKKIMSAKFDFNDFLKQTRTVAKMGSVSRVIGMIPGMAKVWTSIRTILKISIYDSFVYLVPYRNWEQSKQLCATSQIGSMNLTIEQ